jgi:hypothetical protein
MPRNYAYTPSAPESSNEEKILGELKTIKKLLLIVTVLYVTSIVIGVAFYTIGIVQANQLATETRLKAEEFVKQQTLAKENALKDAAEREEAALKTRVDAILKDLYDDINARKTKTR